MRNSSYFFNRLLKIYNLLIIKLILTLHVFYIEKREPERLLFAKYEIRFDKMSNLTF